MWSSNDVKQRDSKSDCNYFKTTRPLKHFKLLAQIGILLLAFYCVKKRGTKIKFIQEFLRFESDMKHILIWTELPGVTLDGQLEFFKNQCVFAHCYLTKNRTLFNDTRYFDAIVFNLQDVSKGSTDLPKQRGYYQKYVFVANDSAEKYPVCDPAYENFFNWTWTYRLDSDIRYQFIFTETKNKEEIKGDNIKWVDLEKKEFLMASIKRAIATKRKAAAIFMDECTSKSKREVLVKDLQKALEKYNLTLDIYGKCGPLNCKRRSMAACNYRIRNDYYFYLALEDTIAKDWVTDVVMHAYDNLAVPVVYGGADYSMFVPSDSYINVKYYNVTELAKVMNKLITHKRLYLDYFEWTKYYKVSREEPLDICDLCVFLSMPVMNIHKTEYYDFREWWNPNYTARCEEEGRKIWKKPKFDHHYY